MPQRGDLLVPTARDATEQDQESEEYEYHDNLDTFSEIWEPFLIPSRETSTD